MFNIDVIGLCLESIDESKYNFAMSVWKQGEIVSCSDIDSELGCTTVRHIIFNNMKYVHIMHNGEILECIQL